jgi:hypothetical protein
MQDTATTEPMDCGHGPQEYDTSNIQGYVADHNNSGMNIMVPGPYSHDYDFEEDVDDCPPLDGPEFTHGATFDKPHSLDDISVGSRFSSSMSSDDSSVYNVNSAATSFNSSPPFAEEPLQPSLEYGLPMSQHFNHTAMEVLPPIMEGDALSLQGPQMWQRPHDLPRRLIDHPPIHGLQGYAPFDPLMSYMDQKLKQEGAAYNYLAHEMACLLPGQRKKQNELFDF